MKRERAIVLAFAVFAILGFSASCIRGVSPETSGNAKAGLSAVKTKIREHSEIELDAFAVKCGESFYFLEIWNDREEICNQMAPGKKWKLKVTEKPLADTDRLNGVDYRAEYAYLYTGPARSAVIRRKSAAGAWTRVGAKSAAWSEWKNWKDLPFLKFDIVSIKGEIKITPQTNESGAQRWELRKMTCADVPVGPGE
jgi:hypothetical protein